MSTASDGWAIHIEANLNDLPASMRHVGRYVLEHKQHASRFDLNTLASETGVSKTTIVRFCQQLGFEGYRDFYASWVASLTSLDDGRHQPPRHKPLAEAVFDEVVHDLARTLHLLDPEALERASALIEAAPAIYFYGLGDSEGVAVSAAHRFTILGKPARAIGTIESLQLDGTLFAPGSVVCVISQSGFHPHGHAMEPLYEHFAGGERVIAITSSPKSKLARFAGTVLLTSASDLLVDKARVTFRASQLAVIDTLALALARSTRAEVLAGPMYERVSRAVAPPLPTEEVASVE